MTRAEHDAASAVYPVRVGVALALCAAVWTMTVTGCAATARDMAREASAVLLAELLRARLQRDASTTPGGRARVTTAAGARLRASMPRRV